MIWKQILGFGMIIVSVHIVIWWLVKDWSFTVEVIGLMLFLLFGLWLARGGL